MALGPPPRPRPPPADRRPPAARPPPDRRPTVCHVGSVVAATKAHGTCYQGAQQMCAMCAIPLRVSCGQCGRMAHMTHTCVWAVVWAVVCVIVWAVCAIVLDRTHCPQIRFYVSFGMICVVFRLFWSRLRALFCRKNWRVGRVCHVCHLFFRRKTLRVNSARIPVLVL